MRRRLQPYVLARGVPVGGDGVVVGEGARRQREAERGLLRRCEVLLGEGAQLTVGPVHAAAQRAHVELDHFCAAHRAAVTQREAQLEAGTALQAGRAECEARVLEGGVREAVAKGEEPMRRCRPSAAAHAAAAHAAGTQLVVPILTVADVEAFAVDDLPRVRGEVARVRVGVS